MNPLKKRLGLLFHSIRLRLALWFVFILAILLTIFSGLVYASLNRELYAEAVTRLTGRWEETEKFFRAASDENTTNLAETALSFHEEEILILYSPQATIQRQWGEFAEPPRLKFSTPRAGQETPLTLQIFPVTRKNTSEEYAFLTIPLQTANNLQGFVALGLPLDPTHQRGRLLTVLGASAAGLLLLALFGGFWLADRAMRPVQRIIQTARQINETDLSQRFNLNSRDEIGQLADTFDAMLARLEAAFTRQRQFTADASHELRTPLTIISLEAERALAAPRPPKEYQRALQIVQSENSLMNHLVNDLLTLARMDAGQTSLKKEPLDLSDLTLEVAERLAPLAAHHNVILATGALPETRIDGDRAALLQMLTNLAENAIKYTSQSQNQPRRVSLATGSDLARGLAWALVSDTGPGIPPEHLEHLFDRFYRVDKARARDENQAPGGSGLGLAIVAGIAKAHRGWVTVASRENEGASFQVFLPLAPQT